MKLSWLVLVLFLSWAGMTLAQTEPETFITLDLSGGAHAGHYELQNDTSCFYGMGGDDSWSFSYSLYLEKPSDNAPDTLGIVKLDIPSEANISTFRFSAALGEEYEGAHYAEYVLDPARGEGAGAVTLDKEGKHALLAVSGTTSDNVNVSATIECLDVTNLSGDKVALDTLELSFPPDAATPTGSVELTVDGTSYHVQTGAEATCSQGVAEEGDLWYEYDPGGSYTGLDLIVQNLELAEAGVASFGFGIDWQPVYSFGDAGGNLIAAHDGDYLTFTVDLQAADGTPLQATIRCSLAE